MQFLPLSGGALEDAAGKGVHQFIRKKVGMSVDRLQCGGGRVVPCDAKTPQEFFLCVPEGCGNFDDMVVETASFPPTELAEDVAREAARTRTDLDDVAAVLRTDPVGKSGRQRAVECCHGGEVAAPTDGGDAGGIVAEGGVVESLLHEAVERDGAAKLALEGV